MRDSGAPSGATTTGQVTAARPPADAGPRTTAVLLVVSAATFLASLDLFIVNIAFPAMTKDFGASAGGLSWVLNGYTIVFAALLTPAGRTADRIGRKRVFLAGLAVFCLASLGCAVAWDLTSLVAFRVLQAGGGALVTATSLALLLHTFPPARRALAIGVWSAIGGVAAALGPPIGGVLVEASWRWVFLVNLPVGVLALVVGLRVLVESRDASETRRPDLLGTVGLVAAVGLLAWALVEAPSAGWGSAATIVRLAAAVLVVGLVLSRAARTPQGLVPVLPLRLFRARAFSLASAAGALFFAAFGAMLLGNVLWLTSGWHYSTVTAGLALVPGPVLAAVSSIPAGRLGARVGCGPVVVAGALLFGIGALWWLTRVGASPDYLTDFLPGQICTGLGVGLSLTNLSAAASSTLPPGDLATGSATFGAARQLGATLGVAVLLAVLPRDAGTGVAASAGADRGWLLVVVLAWLASATALFIGRADHPDLRVAAR